jgi:hypothetical protein
MMRAEKHLDHVARLLVLGLPSAGLRTCPLYPTGGYLSNEDGMLIDLTAGQNTAMIALNA